jgi:hypothetical protein
MTAIHRIQRGLALMIDGRHYEVDRLLEKNTIVQLEDVVTGARIGYPVARLHRQVNAGQIRVLGEPVGGGRIRLFWKNRSPCRSCLVDCLPPKSKR